MQVCKNCPTPHQCRHLPPHWHCYQNWIDSGGLGRALVVCALVLIVAIALLGGRV